MKKKLINSIYFILFLFFVFIFNQSLNAQNLTYNEVKSKGLLLDIDSNNHQLFILPGNLSADYLICDIYIFGKYYLDFSEIQFAKLLFKSDFIKVFLQFASYNKTYDQNELYPYCETFKIQIKIDDIIKIIQNKDNNIFLQFIGKYGIINAKLNKKFIAQLEKLSLEEEDSQIELTINNRPFSLFLVIYSVNAYYTFDNANPVIDDFAFSFLGNKDFTFEVGLYFKIPIISALSIYYSSVHIFDYLPNIQSSKILGLKLYLTVFDISESLFLRFSAFGGLGSYNLNSSAIIDPEFYYFFSLILGFPIVPSIEYIGSISIGKVESNETALLFQVAIIMNLF